MTYYIYHMSMDVLQYVCGGVCTQHASQKMIYYIYHMYMDVLHYVLVGVSSEHSVQ